MFLSKIKNFILDTIFPTTCLGNCGRFDVWLCNDCLKKINAKSHTYLPQTNSGPKNDWLNGLYFAGSYQNELLSKTIHFFKYRYILELKKPLGDIIVKALPEKCHFDLIAFVPLHRKKELIRCFNQTYFLAKAISDKFHWPIIKGVLQRKNNTLAQAQLDEKQRKTNIKNAFICKNKKAIIDKKILLVDDVFTTGSTMLECARVLKQAGASEVWGIVVAHG